MQGRREQTEFLRALIEFDPNHVGRALKFHHPLTELML
jgi:hypothetical protein